MFFFFFSCFCHFLNIHFYQEVIKLEIEIKPEDLSLFLDKIGLNNINRIDVFGINEDGSREKIDISEFISAQKKEPALVMKAGFFTHSQSLSSY